MDNLTELNMECPECGGWKESEETICEGCRISITVENPRSI